MFLLQFAPRGDIIPAEFRRGSRQVLNRVHKAIEATYKNDAALLSEWGIFVQQAPEDDDCFGSNVELHVPLRNEMFAQFSSIQTAHIPFQSNQFYSTDPDNADSRFDRLDPSSIPVTLLAMNCVAWSNNNCDKSNYVPPRVAIDPTSSTPLLEQARISVAASQQEYSNMLKAVLKSKCEERGLSTSGNRQTLIHRYDFHSQSFHVYYSLKFSVCY